MTVKTEGHILFDPGDRIYTDHFPDHPVVPGSVIVQAFAQAVGRPAPLSISQFRFKRFIAPGTYRYSIDVREDHICCRLFDGDKVVATGKIHS